MHDIDIDSKDSLPTAGTNASGKVSIKYYKYELPIPNIDPDI